jgi:hypothetical protein
MSNIFIRTQRYAAFWFPLPALKAPPDNADLQRPMELRRERKRRARSFARGGCCDAPSQMQGCGRALFQDPRQSAWMARHRASQKQLEDCQAFHPVSRQSRGGPGFAPKQPRVKVVQVAASAALAMLQRAKPRLQYIVRATDHADAGAALVRDRNNGPPEMGAMTIQGCKIRSMAACGSALSQ